MEFKWKTIKKLNRNKFFVEQPRYRGSIEAIAPPQSLENAIIRDTIACKDSRLNTKIFSFHKTS